MDTSKDFRILMAENALLRLESRIRVWNLNYPIHKNKALELIRKAKTHLNAVKYSYLPLSYLLRNDDVIQLGLVGKELAKEILPPKGVEVPQKNRLHVAELKYALVQLVGLRARMALGEENLPEYAVDIIGVEVVSVLKHPSAKNLYVTRAGTPQYGFNIITNIRDIKKGEVRAVAVLPPQEFFGLVSEAMYCSDPLPKEYVGKRPPSELVHVKEVAAIVEQVVKG